MVWGNIDINVDVEVDVDVDIEVDVDIFHADIDVDSGRYFMGNAFTQPHTHGRNSQYDYFAAYGDLEPNGGAFGLRFSGHHIDLNFQWDDDGELVNDLPVFLGHNPLIVPGVFPEGIRESNERLTTESFNHRK